MAGLFGSRRRGSAASDAQRAAAAALAAAQQATQSVDGVGQPRGLFGRSMAAAPVAEPEPAAMPAAQTNPGPQKAGGLDVLWKVLAGHSPGEARRIVQGDLDAGLAAQQQQAALVKLQSQAADPQEALLWSAAPDKMAAQVAERYGAAKQPRIVEGPDGIYSIGPDGKPEKIQAYEKQAPSGWIYDGGNLKPIPGGPYDPAYIGSVAGTRRDAVVERPMPRVGGGGRSGGRPGGSTGLPSGFVLD